MVKTWLSEGLKELGPNYPMPIVWFGELNSIGLGSHKIIRKIKAINIVYIRLDWIN